MLQGEGDGTPAELYAGTYTGLCYRCSFLDKIIMKVSDLDGAMHISHAPTQPSYRRDRTHEIGYIDCSDCKGEGRVYTGYHNWSRHYTYCKACHDRYFNHPLRKAYMDQEAYLTHLLYVAGNNALTRNLEKRFGEYMKILPKAKKVKGKGRTKMFYRNRAASWTASYIGEVPYEIKLAIENTTTVYYTQYLAKKQQLKNRLTALHAIAVDDMNVVHPLNNTYG